MPSARGEGVSLLAEQHRNAALPPWRTVAQHLPHQGLPSVAGAVIEQLSRPDVRHRIPPGCRVAIAVGSRGVARIDEIVRQTVASLRELGAEPFIVPAMGSHGNATAEGQAAVLASLGVTEAAVGAPVRAGMDTVQLGVVLDGLPVRIDTIAFTEADAIIPIARVKPHTDFRGPLESGLHKMLAIGLGKHRGAAHLHSFPLGRFSEVVQAVGALVLQRAKVPFGIAVVEDAHEQPAIIEVLLNEDMARREAELLRLALQWLPRLPISTADVLVVQQIGKHISGAGMDPNVTGRFPLGNIEPDLVVKSLVVLDVSEASHGNAAGIGMADITTSRVANKIDWRSTYTNHVAAGSLNGAKLPLVAGTDRDALDIAARCAVGVPPEELQLAWIQNTLTVGEFRVSEPLWASLRETTAVESLSEPEPMRFDLNDSLVV